MNNHAAIRPRTDSAPVRLSTARPNATPTKPSSTELPMCPRAQSSVMTVVLTVDHLRAQDIMMKGK